jgi:hypothetical protein
MNFVSVDKSNPAWTRICPACFCIRAICFDVMAPERYRRCDGGKLRLIRPVHFLFPGKEPQHVARRIVMSIEAPANFLIGLPDLLGFDDQVFALVDKLARHSGRQTRNFKIIPGVKEMLALLSRQYPLAVVSARDETTTRLFLEKFDLMQYFQCIATALTSEHTKPFPDPILWAAAQLDIPAQTCLMVVTPPWTCVQCCRAQKWEYCVVLVKFQSFKNTVRISFKFNPGTRGRAGKIGPAYGTIC